MALPHNRETITWKESMKNREIQWNVMNFYNTTDRYDYASSQITKVV